MAVASRGTGTSPVSGAGVPDVRPYAAPALALLLVLATAARAAQEKRG